MPLRNRVPVLEERLQRLEKDLQRIQPIPEQLRQEQQTFIEAQKLAEVDRTRQMGQWEQDFAQQRELIEKQACACGSSRHATKRLGGRSRRWRNSRRRSSTAQKQVSELQRLAEERQRKELADWQAENEQRWKKEPLRWDYALQEQAKVNQKLTDRFPPTRKAGGAVAARGGSALAIA